MASRAIVAILAGGRGRRMGTPKPTVTLGDRPLISFPIAAALGAGLEVAVVAKPDTPLPPLQEVDVWLEPTEPVHPLQGLVTALDRAGGRPVLAVGCDLPFVTPQLVGWLADSGPEIATVPVTRGRPQPLVARYAPEALPPLRASLAGHQTLTAAVAALPPRFVPEAELRRFGDPARLTLNVNTPEDLDRAAALLSPRSRSSSGEAGETRARPRGA